MITYDFWASFCYVALTPPLVSLSCVHPCRASGWLISLRCLVLGPTCSIFCAPGFSRSFRASICGSSSSASLPLFPSFRARASLVFRWLRARPPHASQAYLPVRLFSSALPFPLPPLFDRAFLVLGGGFAFARASRGPMFASPSSPVFCRSIVHYTHTSRLCLGPFPALLLRRRLSVVFGRVLLGFWSTSLLLPIGWPATPSRSSMLNAALSIVRYPRPRCLHYASRLYVSCVLSRREFG